MPGPASVALPVRPLTEKEVRRLGPVRTYFLDHPVASDVLVCGLVVMAQAVLLAGADVPVDLLVVQLGALAVGVAALAFRRRRPVTVLAVVTAVTTVSLLLPAGRGIPAADVAQPFALYAVAAAYGARVGWAGFGASTAALAGALALGARHVSSATGVIMFGEQPPVDIASPVWVFTWVGMVALVLSMVAGLTFLAVGLSVFARRERVAALVQRSHDLIAVGRQQAQVATMQERSRIAREMHDVVSHSLSVMVTLADGAKAAAVRSPAAAIEALDMLSETGRTALAEMRRMLGVLRADADEPAGSSRPLPTAPPQDLTEDETPYRPQPTADGDLSVLVERFRHAGLAVRWRLEGLPDHQGWRLVVFRILQESLTNVLRHAPRAAAEASVTVTVGRDRRPERVLVQVSDDGAGRRAVAPVGSGRGLSGMRERVALFGGDLVAGPHGTGWQVRAELVVPSDAGPRPSDVWMVPR